MADGYGDGAALMRPTHALLLSHLIEQDARTSRPLRVESLFFFSFSFTTTSKALRGLLFLFLFYGVHKTKTHKNK